MLQAEIYINSRVVASLTAHNDGTGTASVGNYNIEVWEHGPAPNLVVKFRLEGFDRARGAQALVREILNRDEIAAAEVPE
mgnify:CR=1 FL=1